MATQQYRVPKRSICFSADYGILHLGDSFVKRGNRLRNGSWPRIKTAKGTIDSYSRDWAAANKADLERRSREVPDIPPMREDSFC
jgi:hypothetical protein